MYKSDPIKVKKYVADYLIKNYGSEILLPDNHYFMCLWRICAQRKKRMKDKLIAQRNSTRAFGDDSLVEIKFTLTKHTYINFGYYLTPTEEMLFRAMLEQFVKEKLNITYDIAKIIEPEVKIKQMAEYFRLGTKLGEESFTLDNIQKYLYRRRKRNNNNNIGQPTLFE